MASECCCAVSTASSVGENGGIAPVPTETAQRLASMAVSMLGWDHTKLSSQEDAVRRYILTQYPLQGRAPSHQKIGEALGLSSNEVQTILRRLHELDILYLEPEHLEIRLAYPFSSVSTRHVVKFEDWAEAKPVYA